MSPVNKEDMQVVHETSQARRKLGVVVSYAYMAAQVVVQLVYVPLLLGSIGQEEYGLYQLVGSIMSYLVSINGVLSAGVGRFYCKYLFSGDDEKAENTLAIARRLYWIASGLSVVVIGVVMVVFRIVYAGSFSDLQLDECTWMLAVLCANTIVTMNNTVNIAAITAYERFVFLKLSQLVTLIVQPVLVIVLASHVPNALIVTVVVLAMNVTCAAVQRFYVGNVLKAKATYHGWDSALAKNLLGFSVAIAMVTVADQVFWKADQLIIGFFYGASLVAVYAVGAQIYQAYISIGTVVASLFLPRVSELYGKNEGMGEISKLYARVGRVSCLVCVLVFGGFLIIGQDFISLWAGPDYADAYYIAVLVMGAFTVDIVQNLSNTILQVTNQYFFRGYMLLTIAIVNVALTLAMVQAVGIVGAAASTAVCILIGNGLIMNWYMNVKVGINVAFFWRELVKLLVPSALAIAVCYALYWLLPIPHLSWFTIILGGVAYVLALFVTLWRWGLNDYEKRLVRSLFKGVVDRG